MLSRGTDADTPPLLSSCVTQGMTAEAAQPSCSVSQYGWSSSLPVGVSALCCGMWHTSCAAARNRDTPAARLELVLLPVSLPPPPLRPVLPLPWLPVPVLVLLPWLPLPVPPVPGLPQPLPLPH